MVEQPANNREKNWATAGIIISWATFWMFLFLPFGLLAWIGILIYLIVKKSKLKLYFILSAWLFVPSCSFLKGTIRYATGTASLQSVGGPETFHGIDSETRVVSTSSGCIFVGFEPFVFPANNTAVRLWTNLFGFQKGSYKGAFPTEEEAQEIIKSADTLIVNRTDNFLQFNTSGQTVNVDTSGFYRYRSYSSEFDKVVGKTIKNECFIFQRLDNKDKEERKAIYIVDINKSKLLKTYFDY
jgi:hypothetical protein